MIRPTARRASVPALLALLPVFALIIALAGCGSGGGGDHPQTDSDGDGIPDINDNCVHVANPGQQDADHDGIGDACDGSPVTTVFFAADIQPIFDASCIRCHNATCSSCNLNLSAGASHAALVNVQAAGYAAFRVAPGDTTASVLYHKIIGDGVYGPRTPEHDETLSPADITKIATWIMEGALDN